MGSVDACWLGNPENGLPALSDTDVIEALAIEDYEMSRVLLRGLVI
jgi:hypothetical protein